jgi:phospholipid/cholesterol/gamma-HCH transport system substrate-binding protein
VTRSGLRDLLVGLFVLGGIGAVAYLSFRVAGPSVGGPHGLTIYAAFDQTGGLKVRAPVMIAGVKVGQIRAITLDDRFRARVKMDLDPSLKLPADTSASIVTQGILGDRYISLQLGGDPEVLKSGDEIAFTESAVILERLIGKLVHNADVGGGKTAEANR